jgi:hypothetical protein
MLVWKEAPYDNATPIVEFGTVSGDYTCYNKGYPLGSEPLRAPVLAINIVQNSAERTGQFAEFIILLKQHCASQGWDLAFLNVLESLKPRLIEKHGFLKLHGSIHLIYHCAGKALE